MKAFKIVEKCPVNLYGFKVPVGAIYGEDNKGVWVCLNYKPIQGRRIAKPHYTRIRNEGGEFEKVLVTPAKYEQKLKLYRLNASFVGSRYDAGNRWEKTCEGGKTVDKILELARRYPDKCGVKRSGKYKVAHEIIGGELRLKKVPAVSNSEAARITKPINTRVVQEYTPFARPY